MISLRNKLFIVIATVMLLFITVAALLGQQHHSNLWSVLFVLLPLSLLVLYLLIQWCLQPISAVANKLQNNKALSAFSLDKMPLPTELMPLVNACNYQQAIASKSLQRERRVARNAAHQIRNPVSILNVSLHNLENEFKQQGIHSPALQDLQQGVVRISYILDQSLRFNAIQADTYTGQFRQVDLVALSRDCIANNYQQFEQRQQDIELAGESQLTIAGDAKLLQTMLENLLSNASKYTPEQGRILVTLLRRDLHIILRIEDSGPGIEASELPAVFEPFYRVGQDRHDSQVYGSGLGLSIVKNIVDLHQAKITLAASATFGGLAIEVAFG